jgi:hypothetical protein
MGYHIIASIKNTIFIVICTQLLIFIIMFAFWDFQFGEFYQTYTRVSLILGIIGGILITIRNES